MTKIPVNEREGPTAAGRWVRKRALGIRFPGNGRRALNMLGIISLALLIGTAARAQTTPAIDPDKSILEQLREAEAKRLKRKEERAAQQREYEKLTPEQRAEQGCRDYERQMGKVGCRLGFRQKGYRDLFWGKDASHSHSGHILVMAGPDGAVICVDYNHLNYIHDHMICSIHLEKVDAANSKAQ